MIFAWLRNRRLIADEIESHLEERIADLIDEGVPEPEARLRARREFGNPTLLTEISRDQWGWRWIEDLASDVRYAVRMLRRTPGFTAVALLSLALGIGANTAIFSLLDTLLLRSLPVDRPEQLWSISLAETATGKLRASHSYPLYEQWRDHNRSIGPLAAVGTLTWRDLTPGADPALHDGQFLSGNALSVLGVHTAVGRPIAETEDAPVAMLSDRYWNRAFHRDPGVLGRTINVNGALLTIIGVTPPEFFGTQVGSAPDIFVPIQFQPQVAGPDNLLKNPPRGETTWISIIGRMPAGLTPPQVQADLTPIYTEYAVARRNRPMSAAVTLEPAGRGFSRLRERFSEPLQALMFLVVIVLLIACANLSNLLYVRAGARQKEIGIRLAIGAGRFRILRQLLTESLVISLTGGALGLLIALWSGRLLVTMLPQGPTPVALDIEPDLRVLGFTLAISILTGIVFGIAPAWRTAGVALNRRLGRPSSHTARAMLVAEVALAVPMLIGAGLFLATLNNLLSVDAGFSGRNVLQVRFNLNGAAVPPDRWAQVYEELTAKIAAVPGVAAVSVANRGLVENGITTTGPVSIPGYTFQPGESRQLPETYIGASYFAAAGIPLRLGRTFEPNDGAGTHRAIVNEEMARRYFPGRNPIGQVYSFGDSSAQIEIVGVVADAKYNDLRQQAIPMTYYPWRQIPNARLAALVIRTHGDPAVLTEAVRRAVAQVHPGLFVDARTLPSQVENSLVRERMLAHLSGFLGSLALFLAAVGLYGVIAYGVNRRTAEIGVRMALGARPGNVARIVVSEAFWLTFTGIAIGLALALQLVKLAEGFLFGLHGDDPAVFAGAAVLLLATAALAGALPAWRATRVEPVAALRCE